MESVKELFSKIKNFYPLENWGNVEKVSPILILALDRFRNILGCPVHISPLEGAVYAEKGHLPGSWHYIIEGRNQYAMAADVFPQCYIFDAFWTAVLMMLDFGGIGIYPFAQYKMRNRVLKGMLHLDIRYQGPRVSWYRDEYGQYHGLGRASDLDALYQKLHLIKRGE